MNVSRGLKLTAAIGFSAWILGCGDAAVLLLNPSFVNQTQGGLFPLVPGPDAGLILVRTVNLSDQSITFLVTIERATVVDEGGGTGTITIAETTELFTTPGSQSNEAGIVVTCTDAEPITRVGLGRNLNQPTTDSGMFIGGFNDVVPGFGVPPNINPLSSTFGDFFCGDTVIFQAINSSNAPGGFKVQAFVLPFESQPADTVRDTFNVAAEFLRGQPGE